VLKLLSDGPAQATWLTIEEKTVIADRIARDQTTERRSFWLSLRDPRVLTMGLVLFGVTAGGQYGVGLWPPQIVQRMGFSNQETGFIVALPYIVAVPTMILWGRSSDLRRERVWHIAIPLLLGSGCFAVASVTQDNLVEFVALAITAIVAITLVSADEQLGQVDAERVGGGERCRPLQLRRQSRRLCGPLHYWRTAER
jgi:ACS family tartrate transporter-like MFS transporter